MPEVLYATCPECGTRNFPERSHCLGCSRELPHQLSPQAVKPAVESPVNAPATPTRAVPAAVVGYRIYCGVLLCWVLLAGIVVLAAANQPSYAEEIITGLPSGLGSQFEDQFRQERHSQAASVLFLLAGAGLLYAVGLGLKPTPGAWVYGIVVLAIGLLGKCTLPVSVILLILWFQPPTQQYFGRGSKPEDALQSDPPTSELRSNE